LAAITIASPSDFVPSGGKGSRQRSSTTPLVSITFLWFSVGCCL
jgi:hypothetical protein